MRSDESGAREIGTGVGFGMRRQPFANLGAARIVFSRSSLSSDDRHRCEEAATFDLVVLEHRSGLLHDHLPLNGTPRPGAGRRAPYSVVRPAEAKVSVTRAAMISLTASGSSEALA